MKHMFNMSAILISAPLHTANDVSIHRCCDQWGAMAVCATLARSSASPRQRCRLSSCCGIYSLLWVSERRTIFNSSASKRAQVSCYFTCQKSSSLYTTCFTTRQTDVDLYCRRCNAVQRESATSEPGKDSTHLVGVETAGRESWRPRCADHGDISSSSSSVEA